MLVALEKDRRRLAELEIAIWDIGPSLSELIEEEAEVRKRLDDYTYPVLTLPNEVVSEIFVHFLPVYPDAPPLIGIYSPTHLTKICHKWREVALATPVLWRAIQLTTRSDMTVGRAKEISEVWLRLSGSCPLSINIYLPWSGTFTSAVFTPIVAHRARWEHLKINAPKSVFLVINGPMPQLRHSDLFITSIPGGTNDIVAFHGVPLLTTVVLRRPKAEILPWKQLTSLTLLQVNFSNCAAILLQATGLIHCKLIEVWFNTTYIPSDIVLPRLQSLAFHSIRVAADVDGCLNCFILPALRRLEIQEKGLGSAPVLGLESFISKSGCSLQEVCITQAKTKHEASYLEAFPSIPKLSLPRMTGRVTMKTQMGTIQMGTI